ncbi:Oxysterol-binding 1 [Sphaceloma murrayae]|uniref:Oxysterol-binding 1 n=1 Tax=Sphaceloma murrayae TaxID=2082308 RepID=A0A2K1QQA3_9PEZI|nr:Oxysterol-binding 1 [Sphaceloma murrayae]
MTDSSPHKRSKSQIAKSLLHRVSSRHEVQTLGAPDDGYLDPLQHKGSTSNLSVTTSISASRTSTAGKRPHLAPAMNSSDEMIQDSAVPDPDATDTLSAVPPGASIEQSVKLFKVFEALRNADWDTLSATVAADNKAGTGSSLEGTSVLHLAVQIAELSMVEKVLKISKDMEINATDKEGNTPLHIAAMLGRIQVVRLLLEQPEINESVTNYQGKTPLDLARDPEVFQQLQLARSLYVDSQLKKVHELLQKGQYDDLEELFNDQRIRNTLDVNGTELVTDPQIIESGGSLLHEAAKKRDTKLIQMLLMNGADPFRRDRKGKLPQDITKDDRTKAILKKSPAAAAAQRGIQEKAILGSTMSQGAAPGDVALGAKEAREMKGYLKKWTNYTSGYKLRWFVLEDGVLSYYKHQDDAGSACRGAINMKVAKLHLDPKDKLGFEITGKSSVKYTLKANHHVEAKRWYWALNNAIQYAKDEAKDEQRRANDTGDPARSKSLQPDRLYTSEHDGSLAPRGHSVAPISSPISAGSVSNLGDDERSAYAHSAVGDDMQPSISRGDNADTVDDEDDYGDDVSSHEARPANRDAFNITAQSARLQLDLLAQVSTALQTTRTEQPDLAISDASIENALTSYDTAVKNLRGLFIDLLRISKDHEAYWQYRLDREANVRRLWEESMTRVAREQEELQGKIGESEDKRRKTKRALREALEAQATASTDTRTKAPASAEVSQIEEAVANVELNDDGKSADIPVLRKRMTIADYTNNEISDDESEIEDEFFDAVDAGHVEVVEDMPASAASVGPVDKTMADQQAEKAKQIEKSYAGYENGTRKRLKLDADNRPRVSLWGVLKSMIGKDMTKMTLPVTFNEPTSLLYRVVEDMEYTDLLNVAAERADPTERMVYVAAFAASEYASTIGRVAKPFNPLLGETYEYVRPDKGYRFFIEQVSHHPPVGAAFAESAKWDYYGESSVKSKFYGKSFEFNPLGTWFLHLRPDCGKPQQELYTWKKITSSVVGIITGNPQVDNYGPMEIKNHTTGESCILDFKARGWKASSAYIVTGRVLDAEGKVKFSIGGHWNDKIYARSTPGYEENITAPANSVVSPTAAAKSDQAFLVWEASPRPTGIPFNLTPFAVTLNSIDDKLRPVIAPTDTRLRPDQRAMEDGEYDFAASEKLRLEEAQRSRRREREQKGEEFVPRWFVEDHHPVTKEKFWRFKGDYWDVRDGVAKGAKDWDGQRLEEIF